jgi:predicted enzyme involved in methoxymalonyl-ACP biosynthesis
MKKQEGGFFIDTWIMSCRVLKRTMENFVLNTIVSLALQSGCEKIIGEFIPTAKNKMVKDHYKNFGFSESNGLWSLDLKSYKLRKTFIIEKAS